MGREEQREKQKRERDSERDKKKEKCEKDRQTQRKRNLENYLQRSRKRSSERGRDERQKCREQRKIYIEKPRQTNDKHTGRDIQRARNRDRHPQNGWGGCTGGGWPFSLPGPSRGSTAATLSQKILIWQTARCTRHSVPEPQS